MKEFFASKKILITGGDGFLGSAIVNKLYSIGVKKHQIIIPQLPQDDLLNYENCSRLTQDVDIVIHLAAKVGGILYNQKYPGSMLHDNLLMGLNVMETARLNKVQKIINIGTTCAYPENAPIPFKEQDLWNGYPASVTAPYGLAKRMLSELGKAYKEEYGLNSIFLLPVNLYGPGDHFEGENTHVIPALIKRFVEAVKNGEKEIAIWGSGKATREFLFVDDAAEAILLATHMYNESNPVNLGTGIETSIKDLISLLVEITGYKGQIVWDKSKPDGTPRRFMNVDLAKKEFGFQAKTKLIEGLILTVNFYRNFKL